MALNAARGADRVVLLGRSEPFAYDAGEMNGKSFPAGRSFKVIVGHDEMGYTELKVKGEDFHAIWSVVQPLGRGVELEIEYEDPRMRGQLRVLRSVKVLAHAAK